MLRCRRTLSCTWLPGAAWPHERRDPAPLLTFRLDGMSTPSVQTLQEQVRAIVDDVLAQQPSYFLVELEVRGAPGSQVVDVFVDGDDDIGLDDLAQISRDISFALDVEDPFPNKFNLNVSTPGVERPLRMLRQYRKNIGRTLQVHYRKPSGSGNSEVTGELTNVEEDSIAITQEGQAPVTIALDAIHWAKVRLPW